MGLMLSTTNDDDDTDNNVDDGDDDDEIKCRWNTSLNCLNQKKDTKTRFLRTVSNPAVRWIPPT